MKLVLRFGAVREKPVHILEQVGLGQDWRNGKVIGDVVTAQSGRESERHVPL
jgi:hypothetical protein